MRKPHGNTDRVKEDSFQMCLSDIRLHIFFKSNLANGKEDFLR